MRLVRQQRERPLRGRRRSRKHRPTLDPGESVSMPNGPSFARGHACVGTLARCSISHRVSMAVNLWRAYLYHMVYYIKYNGLCA